MPQKPKLGQNFLRDQNAIRRIVAALGDISHETVIEIGPGQILLDNFDHFKHFAFRLCIRVISGKNWIIVKHQDSCRIHT